MNVLNHSAIALCLIVLPSAAVVAQDATDIRNVLLIVSDDLKASVLGCYGDEVCQTPNLDRLAANGMVFQRAYCQATWCAPSRQSFMYGKYAGTSQQTIGEYFRASGMYTARVGKIFHMKVPGDIIAGTDGLDVPSSWTQRFNAQGQEAHTPGDYACLNLNIFTRDSENRQSTAMPHRMFVTVRQDGDGSDQPDSKSATKAIELLQEHHAEPFFLAVGFVRPHYPMVAPHSYFDRYDYRQIKLPKVPNGDLDDIPTLGLTGTRNGNNSIGKYPDNQKRMWEGYYASVTFMDTQVGRVLDELDQLGIRDQTAVVFTSDHGYHLGEHTLWQKSNLHEEVTRVPLIIDAPGFEAGTSRSLVELIDLYPTLVRLSGKPVPDDVDGESLVPILREPSTVVRDSSYTRIAKRQQRHHAIRTDRWAYMRYSDGSEELYDMRDDPDQFTNLARDERHARTLADLRGKLDVRIPADPR